MCSKKYLYSIVYMINGLFFNFVLVLSACDVTVIYVTDIRCVIKFNWHVLICLFIIECIIVILYRWHLIVTFFNDLCFTRTVFYFFIHFTPMITTWVLFLAVYIEKGEFSLLVYSDKL